MIPSPAPPHFSVSFWNRYPCSSRLKSILSISRQKLNSVCLQSHQTETPWLFQDTSKELPNNCMLKKHDGMLIVFHNREIYKWMKFGLICVQSWTTVFSTIWNVPPWFSLLCCSFNSFQNPLCKDILLNRGVADLHVFWGDGKTSTSWLGGVNKLGNVAVCLLIISSSVHWTENVQVWILDMATLLLNINTYFDSYWEEKW